MVNKNLLFDEWIPVIKGNKRVYISINEIFNEDVRCLSPDSPEHIVTLNLFIYNIFQTFILDSLDYTFNIRTLANKRDAFDEFLKNNKEYFYITNSEYPFLQNDDVQFNKKNPISLLGPFCSGRNGSVLLNYSRATKSTLCFKCAANTLMYEQWLSTMAGRDAKSPRIESSCVFLLVERNNIINSLISNLVNKHTFELSYTTHDQRHGDKFYWKDIKNGTLPYTDVENPLLMSVYYNMWNMCRNIKLLANNDKNNCTVCGCIEDINFSEYSLGEKMPDMINNEDVKMFHPLSLIYRDKKGNECKIKCNKIDEYGHYDRYAYSLFSENGASRYIKLEERLLQNNLRLFGISHDSGKTFKSIYNIFLPKINSVKGSRDLYNIAKSYESQLEISINNFVKEYRLKNKRTNSSYIDSLHIRREFYRLTNDEFLKCSSKYNNLINNPINYKFTEEDIKKEFRTHCLYIAHKIFINSFKNIEHIDMGLLSKLWVQIGGKVNEDFNNHVLNKNKITSLNRFYEDNSVINDIRIKANNNDLSYMKYDQLTKIVSEITNKYEIDCFNFMNDIVKILIKFTHNERVLFPIQCNKNNISEQRFLFLFNVHLSIIDRIKYMKNILDFLSKNEATVNYNTVFNIMLSNKISDTLKYVSAYLFFNN